MRIFAAVQLVILIYIYHFPKGNLSVKIDYLFSFMILHILIPHDGQAGI